jgi:glyoxylase I family protein
MAKTSGKSTEFQSARHARRGANKIRRLHHHAVRTDDMDATRQFYEGVLGMPMVAALRQDSGPLSSAPFLHCFFEMADGSSLAFFQFAPGTYGPATTLPKDGMDHHVAVSVGEFGEISRLKAQFDELGYPNCGIDHGFCYSLYVRDPNGILVELVNDAPNELEINEASARSAEAEFSKWRQADYSSSDLGLSSDNFPLPTSTGEDIYRVLRGGRAAEVR